MIDKNNYYETVKDIDFSNLSSSMRKAHKLVNDVSRDGKDWSNYDKSATIQNVFKGYFEKLEALLPTAKRIAAAPEPKKAIAKPKQVAKETAPKKSPEKATAK